MPAIIPAIANELANGARDMLRQGGSVLTGNQGNYIANGEPESIYGKLQQGAARQACRRYADDPEKFTGAAAVLVENACRPYLDDIGYGGPPTVKLPFRGGQCENVNYQVTIRSESFPFFDCSTLGPTTSTNGFAGPIRGLRFAVVNPSGPLCTPGRNTAYLQHGPPGNESVVAGAGYGVTASILSVVAENPQSPDCGNPLPIIEPPTPPPTPGPRREPFSPTPDIDIDIEVEINPDLTIEVDFGTGPITIDPFGEGGGEGGDGGGDGAPPGDVGDPGDTEGTGEGGDAEGEAPEGTVLTGLRIDFAEPPIGGNEYAAGIYRGVCYIYMGTPDGLDHDPAGAMLRSGQFVFAEKDNLTRWAVSANDGYSLNVTPYYRAVEAEG